MAERKGLTKKQRFEVFKRDGFTCQYCGRRPPEVVLVVDHINPVANGGDNDPLNLTTSCYECNAGKGKTQLADVRPMPDVNDENMALQQEIAEMALYSQLKVQRDEWRDRVITQLQQHWARLVGGNRVPNAYQITRWMTYSTPQQIEKAIDITGKKGFYERFDLNIDEGLRYASGCLRKITQEEG